jgi:hypothetical protein
MIRGHTIVPLLLGKDFGTTTNHLAQRCGNPGKALFGRNRPAYSPAGVPWQWCNNAFPNRLVTTSGVLTHEPVTLCQCPGPATTAEQAVFTNTTLSRETPLAQLLKCWRLLPQTSELAVAHATQHIRYVRASRQFSMAGHPTVMGARYTTVTFRPTDQIRRRRRGLGQGDPLELWGATRSDDKFRVLPLQFHQLL